MESVRGFAVAQRQFISFDGGVRIDSRWMRPDRYRFFEPADFPIPTISRGAGLSYSAASFGNSVLTVDQTSFNRILSFDAAAQTIEVEAGMTLGALYEFLTPKNLFLATQPGHPLITVGGCVAPDIHGKNQFRDGTCIDQVLAVSLFHPSHGVIRLSRDDEDELFRLTCGGYGLTGNILSIKLKLKKIPSGFADVTLVPVERAEDLPRLLSESSARSDFVFSWHDFSASGENFGKGFIQEGKFAQSNETIRSTVPKQNLSAEARANFPARLFNGASLKLLNTLYGRKKGSSLRLSLFDCIFPIQGSKELYFKFFGREGFHEYQVVVPSESFGLFITSVRQWLESNSLPITLASGKLFAGEQDLLRFTGNGIAFALNFPRCQKSLEFLTFLDRLVLECKGIPNIIKDSRLPKDIVRQAYPEYEKFREKLNEFDQKRLYKSELSERLGL